MFKLDTQGPTASVYWTGNYDLFSYSGYSVSEAEGANHRAVFPYSPGEEEAWG